MSEIEEIVRGLTKAQRDTIFEAVERTAVLYGPDCWQVSPGSSVIALCHKRLIRDREFRGLTGRSKRGYALTPLGLAVREALIRKDYP